MIRCLLSCTVPLCLAGCLAGPAALRDAAPPLPSVAAVGQYHFGWKLSGNRAVAPLQVFDDGRRTWLQFPAGQPVPAIFARLPHGDQLLAPTAGTTGQEGLWMLDGVWPQLMMRGGALQSIALRLPVVADAPAAHMAPAASPVTASAAVSNPSRAAQPLVSTVPASPVHDTSPPNIEPVFAVSPADGTLRAALSRWAGTAGWTFGFAHWAVDVDIPIVAAATFTLPFEQAVQELVASTELSDQPVRPCFYTNRVLRIVPHTQPCDRGTAGHG